MIKTKTAIIVLLLFAFTNRGFTQQVHAFSLQQALEYAQKNNVQVKNAILDVQLQEQVNREVTGSAYPQISASGDLTYNAKIANSVIPAEFFGGTAGTYLRIPFGVKWTSTGGVSLSQILFDGQVFTGLQARKTLIEYKEKNVEVTQESIRQNIAKVYYQLVLGKTQIALIDTNIALLEKNKHDTKIMYDNGFAEKLDIDKLDVQITNLQSQRTNTQNQIVNGYLGLKVLMGMPVQEHLILTDTLTDEKIREGVLEASVFDYGQRKDFQLAEMGMKLNEYDVQRYKRSKIPTLRFSGYLNEMAQSNSFDLYGSHSYWSPVSALALNLNIPIFTGGANNAKIAQAKIKLQQTQNQVDALKLSIDLERESAVNTFKSAITDMDYQKRNMALAEKVYQQTKKKYEAGTGSQLEIDNARVQLQSAQTNYYNALYNAVIAKVDFLKATGKL
ncbi:MAG: TolC family protein [Niabella sp.]